MFKFEIAIDVGSIHTLNFNCSDTLDFNCSDIQDFNCSDILDFNCGDVPDFNCSDVLDFNCKYTLLHLPRAIILPVLYTTTHSKIQHWFFSYGPRYWQTD